MNDSTLYLTLGQAAKLTPGRPSTTSIWRWCRKGVTTRSGERFYLRHIRVGGRVFTTEEWLNSYFVALAEADIEHFERQRQAAIDARRARVRPRTEAQRQRDIALADARCRANGL